MHCMSDGGRDTDFTNALLAPPTVEGLEKAKAACVLKAPIDINNKKRNKNCQSDREVLFFDDTIDTELHALKKRVRNDTRFISPTNDYRTKAKLLVAEVMKLCGGRATEEIVERTEQMTVEYMNKHHTRLIPIGVFLRNELGVCRHCASLFKYLCDVIHVPCRLVRGEVDMSGHAWNVITPTSAIAAPAASASGAFLVELMSERADALIPASAGSAGSYHRMDSVNVSYGAGVHSIAEPQREELFDNVDTFEMSELKFDGELEEDGAFGVVRSATWNEGGSSNSSSNSSGASNVYVYKKLKEGNRIKPDRLDKDFRYEVEGLAQCTHSGIVRIIAKNVADRSFLLERCDAGNLMVSWQRTQLSSNRRTVQSYSIVAVITLRSRCTGMPRSLIASVLPLLFCL